MLMEAYFIWNPKNVMYILFDDNILEQKGGTTYWPLLHYFTWHDDQYKCLSNLEDIWCNSNASFINSNKWKRPAIGHGWLFISILYCSNLTVSITSADELPPFYAPAFTGATTFRPYKCVKDWHVYLLMVMYHFWNMYVLHSLLFVIIQHVVN